MTEDEEEAHLVRLLREDLPGPRQEPYSEATWTPAPLALCKHGACGSPRRSHDGPPFCKRHGG